MHTVELYERVRRAVVVEGKGKRQVAREFGISRHMVRKMLQHSVPPGYQRKQPVRRPKLDPWLGTIDAILQEDQNQPIKQRHTAKRIFDRLREEYGYGGGYTIVKDFVRLKTLRGQEMFVPLAHPPGEAQADFGEAKVVIGGVEQTAHFLTLTLAYSDECFVMAFPAETTEGEQARREQQSKRENCATYYLNYPTPYLRRNLAGPDPSRLSLSELFCIAHIQIPLSHGRSGQPTT